jgi:hypothetical protein
MSGWLCCECFFVCMALKCFFICGFGNDESLQMTVESHGQD